MKINSKVKKTYLADKNKEKSKFKKKLKRKFLCGESGAVALSFLIMFPFILSFLALAIDGSRLIMKTNRLNRVLNESALAVSASRLADKLEITDQDEINELHKTLLKDYVVVHFPDDELESYNVTSQSTTSDDESTTSANYTLTAKIKVKTLLPLDGIPSFGSEIEISTSGKAKQTTTTGSVPTDFAFALDFSSSMNAAVGGGLDSSSMSRIEQLKKVLADVLPRAIAANANNKVTILPYTFGVPEKLGTNPAGGERIGCTLYRYSTGDALNIDHSFWSRMAYHVGDTYPTTNDLYAAKLLWGEENLPQVTFKAVGGYSKEVVKLDFFRYEYYLKYVAVATGYSMDKMVELGWCTNNQGTEYGEIVPYSCAQSYETKLTSAEGQKIVADEYKYFEYYQQTYPELDLVMPYIAFPYTLKHLFDDDSDSLITFELEWVPALSKTYPPDDGGQYCMTSGIGLQRSVLTISKEYVEANIKKYFPNVKMYSYMINLTNDLDELNAVQDMYVNGGTDSIIALLRGAQELKKGTNKRKVFIFISDGADTFGISLTKAMHQTYNVCSKIREGLIANSPGTEEVLFYFIATVNELDDTMAMWSTYCTDTDLSDGEASRTMLASDYSSLSKALLSIVEDQSEVGSIAVD